MTLRELAIIGAKASSGHFEDCDYGDTWEDCQQCRWAFERAHRVIAAALPEIERTVREQASDELRSLAGKYQAAAEEPGRTLGQLWHGHEQAETLRHHADLIKRGTRQRRTPEKSHD